MCLELNYDVTEINSYFGKYVLHLLTVSLSGVAQYLAKY